MNPHDPIPRTFSAEQLHDSLTEIGGTAGPDYLDDLIGQAARTRQRPAWTFLERWIPVTLITYPGTRARPVPRAWRLLVVAGLTLALVAGLVAGAMRLLDPDVFRASLMVPVVKDASPWGPDLVPALRQPGYMDVGPDGRLVVPDMGNARILVISSAGDQVVTFGSNGSQPGQFSFQRGGSDAADFVAGAAWMADGSIAIADTMNRHVQVLTDQGAPIREWGSYGPGGGQFLEPFDVAVGPDGDVHVVDDVRDDISRFEPDGSFVGLLGRHGPGDGEMDFTGGVAVDAAGNVFNADYGNQRVQSWDASGAFRWSTPIPVRAAPDGAKPVDVDVDRDGFVYVTTEDARLWVLTSDGKIVHEWSDPANTVGGPHSIAVAPDGTVYLGSLLGNTIQRVEMDRQALAVEPTPAPSSRPSGSPAPSGGPAPSAPPSITLATSGIFSVPLTLDAPSRWRVNVETRGAFDTVLVRDAETTPAYVTAFVPLNAYLDPCQAADGPMDPPVGPTVDDLVAVLTSLPGHTAGPVTDVVIDGHRGKQFDLDNAIDVSQCTGNPWLPQWTFDEATAGVVKPADAPDLARSHERIAVLDVDGTRVLLLAWNGNGSRPDEIAETWAVFDSVDFQ